MTTKKTTARTLRIDDEVLIWGKRAARKQRVSLNKFFKGVLRAAFEQRHDKNEVST